MAQDYQPAPKDWDSATAAWGEAQFRQVLEVLPAAAYMCDAQGLITYFNQHAAKLWGREPKLSDPAHRYCGSLRMYTPSGTPLPHDQCWMAITLQTGQEYNGKEVVIEREDGSRITALAHVRPIHNETGQIIGAVNIVVDITERREAEKTKALLAAIVETSDDAIYSLSLEGRLLSWNIGAQRLFGYSANEALGTFIHAIIPSERLSEEQELMERLCRYERVEHYDTVRVTKNGRRIDVSLTMSPMRDDSGHVIGVSEIARDITAQKQAAESLRASQQRFAQFMQHLPGEAWIKDLEGRYVFINAAGERMYGKSSAELAGQYDEEIFSPETAARYRQTDQEALRAPAGTEALETLDYHDGRHHAIVSKFPIPGPDGKPAFVGGVAIDITQRVEAEQALLQAQRQLQAITDTMAAAVVQCSADGRYLWVSREYAAQVGLPVEQIVGRTIRDVLGSVIHDQIRPYMDRVLAGEPKVEYEVQINYPQTGLRWVHVVYVPTYGDHPQPDGWVAAISDVTWHRELEGALRESEARFRHMADGAPVMIWLSDVQQHCTWFNKPWLDFVGRSLEAELRTAWSENLHPDDYDRCLHTYLQAFESRQPFSMDYRLRRHDGEYRWVADNGMPMYDGAGEFLGYIGSAIDITERKHNEAAILALKDELAMQLTDMKRLHEMSIRLLKTLEMETILEETLRTAAAIEGSEFGLISLYDPESQQLKVGASLGFDPEFLKAIECIAPGSGACGTCFQRQERVIVEDVETDPLFAPYREAARRAGFRAVHSTPLITRSGKIVGVLSTVFAQPCRPSDRDLHLVDLCVRQAVDFIENAQLYVQLREADRRKDEFLATLAHELRNPLAPIYNSLQILRLSDDLDPAVERMREILERQVNHMIRLVDDLLEVSRITRGKIELRKETIELAAVVRSAVETSRPLIEAAGHQLAITLPTEPMSLEADPVRLAQVISNLLNNAAKYTDHGGQIWLNVRREQDQAVISVRDTGVGISAEMLPKVFDMFAQVDHSLNRAHGGLGIGLTLARSLVQMHDGQIEARSEGFHQGSEFIVHLPLTPTQGRHLISTIPPGAHVPLSARHILVVDDAQDSAFILGKLLEKMGQEVRTVFNAREALEQVRIQPPQIVISDIAMPHMNGYELAAELRREFGDEGFTLVALTGYGQDGDRQRAKEAGFHHHLVKPVSIEALRELLSLPSRSGWIRGLPEAHPPRLPK